MQSLHLVSVGADAVGDIDIDPDAGKKDRDTAEAGQITGIGTVLPVQYKIKPKLYLTT